MSNKQLFTIIGGALLLFVIIIGITLAGWQLYYNTLEDGSNDVVLAENPLPASKPTIVTQTVKNTSTLSATTPLQSSEPTNASIEIASSTTPEVTQTTIEKLQNAILPYRDQRELAMLLKHHTIDIPEVVHATPPTYAIGDQEMMWITDNFSSPPRQMEVQATLMYITDHSYWWVANEFNVSQADLEKSANIFETQTYPTNRAFFGTEWSPGVDNDEHIHILMGNVPGVAGYFAAANSYSKLAEAYSNEREMFFINLNAIRPGTTAFDQVLAHEFQHMIHWHEDRNEDTWLNEGASELATFINGYGTSQFAGVYLAQPETQLNTWAVNPADTPANYGGGFLFLAYFLERYGETMMQAVVANPQNGMAGFDAVLADHDYTEQFNDIFADFLVANYLNDADINNGHWGYRDLPLNQTVRADEVSSYPYQFEGQINQYGANYLILTNDAPLKIDFSGDTTISVLDNSAYSGSYQWYSHRGDDTNTRLIRPFDLTAVTTATLKFWHWYDIEPDWDYGYVSISTDDGQTWHLLQSAHSSTSNPTGNAYGPGYTGFSDGWVEESIDISEFAGQLIQLRFDMVTDDAVNHPGWAIDDIAIPEIDFFDDFERGPNEWQAEGFVLMDNIMPQRFLVQLIEIGDETTVRQLLLDENNNGSLTIDRLGSTVEEAVLIISGLTPITTQPATYQYLITE